MAFNPFHSFRKHSKVLFAVLTIICMLTFILTGTGVAGGDAMDFLVGLVGARKQGEVVTDMYGKPVYDGEVRRQAYLRQAANDFMSGIVVQNITEVLDRIKEDLSQLQDQKELSSALAEYRRQISTLYVETTVGVDPSTDPVLRKILETDPQAAQRRNNPFGAGRPISLFSADTLDGLRRRLEAEDRTAEAQVVSGMIGWGAYVWRFPQRFQRNERPMFFGGSTNRQDMLDFLMWQHQADRLGIQMTDDAVRAKVNLLSPVKPILTGNSATDQAFLRKVFQTRYKDIDLGFLYKALAEEFRVSLTQGAILGQEPGFLGLLRGPFEAPSGVTPEEYLSFYRDNRTSMKAQVLSLPVSAFLNKVTTEPREKELENLFNSFRGQEMRPWSATPGFKQPQRVALEWVITANVTPANFQQAALGIPNAGYLRTLTDTRESHYHETAETLLRAGGPLNLATNPFQAIPWTALTATATLRTAYDGIKTNFRVPSLLTGDPTLAYHTAMNLPTAQAALVGQAVPGTLQLMPIGALANWQAAPLLRGKTWGQDKVAQAELTRRSRVLASTIGASFGPAVTRVTPWVWADYQEPERLPFTLTASPVDPPLSTYVPAEALTFQILEEAAISLGRSLQQGDLDLLQAELRKANGDADAVKKILADAEKRFVWWKRYHGKTTSSVDALGLLTAPELASLRNVMNISSAVNEESFSKTPDFFRDSKLFAPEDRFNILYWRTDNVPAKTLSYTEARDAVRLAWRMQQARKEAQKAALALRDSLKGLKPEEASKRLQQVLAENPGWSQIVTLKDVVRQTPKTTDRVLPNQAMEYEPYKIPESIAYPAANFVTELLKLQQHEAGVLEDRPGAQVFVAYVENRMDPPSIEAILKERSNAFGRENIWAQLSEEEVRNYRASVLKELRREAGPLNVQGRFALRPGIKADEGQNVTADE